MQLKSACILFYLFLISLFLIASALQLGFILIYRIRPGQQVAAPASPPVSVIICARNEAGNLRQFLPLVLAQDYPGFEVIVVNDGSADDTARVLAAFEEQAAQLRVVSIPPEAIKDIPGKKFALARGIAAARYERLLLTDADCRPASPLWLQRMATHLEAVVLGYGAYEARPGLLNRFIRWETVHTCMQYTGLAAAGLPYMGVGRNLCYDKKLLLPLEQDEHFQKIYRSTPSGDDDLLIGKIARKGNTGICLLPEAHTLSLPQENWRSWWRQKSRHASTGKYYAAPVKALLGLYGLSHSLYWLPGIGLLLYSFFSGNPLFPAIAGIFALRLVLYWVNAAAWYRQLGEKKLLLFYPLGDLGWALYNVFLSPYILWKNKQAWK